MIECEIVTAKELRPDDEIKWSEFCKSDSKLQSPLLSPGFFHEVSKVRDDVFVAIYREKERPIAFLGFHRRPNNFARPVGAPFSDYSALICQKDANIDMILALKLANIDKFRAIGWVDPHNKCPNFAGEADEAHGVDLLTDEAPHSANKKHRKNVKRLRRHLTDAYGEVRFIFDDCSRENFEKMIELKRAQTRKTGVHDFLSPNWVQNLMNNMFDAPKEKLHGSLLTLMAGDRPIAWQFGPKLGGRMHPWIFTYDPEFAQYSPGQIFLMDCAEILKANDVEYNDLSTGDVQYKNTFCNTHFPVKHGTIYADGTNQAQLGGVLGKIAGKLSRRIDQIACLELDFEGRLNGVKFALLNAKKRI